MKALHFPEGLHTHTAHSLREKPIQIAAAAAAAANLQGKGTMALGSTPDELQGT